MIVNSVGFCFFGCIDFDCGGFTCRFLIRHLCCYWLAWICGVVV